MWWNWQTQRVAPVTAEAVFQSSNLWRAHMTDKYTEGVVRQAVKEIVSSIIGLPSDAAELDESLEQVCDSLDFIDIAMELEDHFVIEFEETELERMLTVDTIVEVVLKKVS